MNYLNKLNQKIFTKLGKMRSSIVDNMFESEDFSTSESTSNMS